jgi:hypothetical protein
MDGDLFADSTSAPTPAVIDISQLPDIATAQLPASYAEACHALEVCAQVDECKDWADRAAALASYAKQAGDEQLFAYARRIQGRAYQRCGELLQQFEPGKTGPKPELQDGAVPQLTRTDAAKDAGLSERQRKTALRVAAIPEEEFERRIESDHPPTVTELAELGTQHQPPKLNGRSEAEFQQATHLLGMFTSFFRDVQRLDIATGVCGLDDEERGRVQMHIADARNWLTKLQGALDV